MVERLYAAVAHTVGAVCGGGHYDVICDDECGHLMLLAQPLQKQHDPLAGNRIERPGRLVGEK